MLGRSRDRALPRPLLLLLLLPFAAALAPAALAADVAVPDAPAPGAAARGAPAAGAAGLSLHPAAGFWRPSTVFVQYGVAEDAQMAALGLAWDWRWQYDVLGGQLLGYWEASFGRWNADNGGGAHGWFTQVGLTPVLRYQFGPRGRWFAEAGIGANLLLPLYQTEAKRFSTTFNFGDHLALGRRFGIGGQHSLSLRFQHFSNASIRKPNPGENFVQLRYARRF